MPKKYEKMNLIEYFNINLARKIDTQQLLFHTYKRNSTKGLGKKM